MEAWQAGRDRQGGGYSGGGHSGGGRRLEFQDCDGVELIETLRWDGQGFDRLALHLARLTASAQRLRFSCDPAAAGAALRAVAPAGRAARMRLTLNAAGHLRAVAADLPDTRAQWRLALATARLSSSDPWLGVKSTRRAVYDAARAALPEGVEELLFQNERGEVCDGTITTVFFDAGAGLRTPPLQSGLLPGVLRAEMLAQGRVSEEVLMAQDLPRVRLWLGNSLRGLMPAVWVG